MGTKWTKLAIIVYLIIGKSFHKILQTLKISKGFIFNENYILQNRFLLVFIIIFFIIVKFVE